MLDFLLLFFRALFFYNHLLGILSVFYSLFSVNSKKAVALLIKYRQHTELILGEWLYEKDNGEIYKYIPVDGSILLHLALKKSYPVLIGKSSQRGVEIETEVLV